MPITYDEISSIPDPLAANRHTLIFPTIVGRNSKPLTLRNTRITLPAFQVGQIRVKILGHPILFRGGNATENTFQASFIETSYDTTLELLMEWQKLVLDRETGLGGLKSEYALGAELNVANIVGDTSHRFNMINVWPVSIQCFEIGEESNAAQIEVTFGVDAIDLVYQKGESHRTGKTSLSSSASTGPSNFTGQEFGNIGIDEYPSVDADVVANIGNFMITAGSNIIPPSAFTLAKFATNFATLFKG